MYETVYTIQNTSKITQQKKKNKKKENKNKKALDNDKALCYDMNIRNGRKEKTETVRNDGRLARTKRKTMASLKGGNNGKRNEKRRTGLESSYWKSYCSRTPRLEQGTA